MKIGVKELHSAHPAMVSGPLLDEYNGIVCHCRKILLDTMNQGEAPIAFLKSNLEINVLPLNFARMSSCRGIGRFKDCRALFTFLASSVIFMSPFDFGAIVAAEIHGIGSLVQLLQ